jgi:cellulose synthase/poly-beta-1,6-N-acetylglucosamine synthase-like glycosyltransferase
MTGAAWPLFLTVASMGLLVYTYAGYPALLWLLGRFARQENRKTKATEWPTVSILLSAYNEEEVIAERIDNLLALDYPPERLEILVGSDGSTDRTCERIGSYRNRGVRLVPFERRRGKAGVVNDLVYHARGEIAVLTDANTFFHPEAVRELVKALRSRPSACAVVGRLVLQSSIATGNLDGVYWRYENFIKLLESRFGIVLGANGAIYAFRRDRYHPLPQGAIVDDFLIPMLMRLHSGGRVYFVPEAKAWEKSPEHVRDEFRRRVRIGAGDLQALLWTWPLLLPWRGLVSMSYFSHKVLRWFGPWLMIIAFLSNLCLLDAPFFQRLFILQLAVYGLGLGAGLVRLLGKVAAGLHFFIVLNAALLLGFVRFALGLARPFWNTVPRRSSLPSSDRKAIMRR